MFMFNLAHGTIQMSISGIAYINKYEINVYIERHQKIFVIFSPSLNIYLAKIL